MRAWPSPSSIKNSLQLTISSMKILWEVEMRQDDGAGEKSKQEQKGKRDFENLAVSKSYE